MLFFFGYFEIFAKWDSWFYYLGVFTLFWIGYFVFEFLHKEIDSKKFSFSEAYIGLILLIILWLGYWIAFRVYYGNIANLNNIAYSDLYTRANMSLFKTLFNSVYIHISLSFFTGWLAFYIKTKTHK